MPWNLGMITMVPCLRRLDDAMTNTDKHTHWIAMSGSHGCLPDSCNAYETYQDSVDSLAELFSLGRTRKARLFADRILELKPRIDGAEYCEIVRCSCSSPWDHCDAGQDPRDWSEYQSIN